MAARTPIAAGRVEFHLGTEFASLWGGGTLPAWRRRGVFRALVAHRATLASARGFRYLQVDASPDSRPILERLGFVELATTTPFMHAWDPMPVDVVSEIVIDRPRAAVAAFAIDPANATAWYENIKAVEWKSEPPVAIGSRIAFVAEFLGRRLTYIYEVIELVPGERFVMRTAEGPFPMETTYAWEDAADGGTRMTLRNRGEPSGFTKVAAPVMARAMRRANGKDLRRLKEILGSAES